MRDRGGGGDADEPPQAVLCLPEIAQRLGAIALAERGPGDDQLARAAQSGDLRAAPRLRAEQLVELVQQVALELEAGRPGREMPLGEPRSIARAVVLDRHRHRHEVRLETAAELGEVAVVGADPETRI